jgi:hypothetical protein
MGKKRWCPLEGPTDDAIIYDARKFLYHRLPFPAQVNEVRSFFQIAPRILKVLGDPVAIHALWLSLAVSQESGGRLKCHEGLAVLAIYEARCRHHRRAEAFLHLARERELKDRIADMKPDAKKGKEFAPRGRSVDALGKEIERTYRALRKARKKELSAREVFDNLPAAPGAVITAVENDVIYWTGAKGREEEMTFKAFKTRLSRLKKKIPA